MTLTVTDLFCGAGGSSLGAESAGMTLTMAANHWQTAVDVHQAHFPDADHDHADISQVDPRRYPRTDILLASPECTNHSQARGVSRRQQQRSLFDDPDPSAERSRATMWDVPRFAEQMSYDAIVVENVVEATKWVGWRGWHQVMADLGYDHRVLSHNSMHHGVPQSRDRIYVVFWRKGLSPDLELEVEAHCPRCESIRTVRQAWKNSRTVGRYKAQWVWRCTVCQSTTSPPVRGAADIIDWSLDCPRIGDRKRPLADATRARIAAGIAKWWRQPITTAGAGSVYETTPGNRSKPLTVPVPTQTTTAQTALSTPPGFMVQPNHSGSDETRIRSTDEPLWTVCASDDRPALVMRNNTPRGDPAQMVTPVTEPIRTITTAGHQSLLVPLRRNGHATPTSDPAATVTAGGSHHGLLTSYYGTGGAQPTTEPTPTVTTRDRCGLVDPVDVEVDDCGFRMLDPAEIAAAMAFPDGYIPADLTKRDRVKLAGNAVTPPVMAWITGRLAQALEAAS